MLEQIDRPGYATYLAVLACAFVLIRKIGSE